MKKERGEKEGVELYKVEAFRGGVGYHHPTPPEFWTAFMVMLEWWPVTHPPLSPRLAELLSSPPLHPTFQFPFSLSSFIYNTKKIYFQFFFKNIIYLGLI